LKTAKINSLSELVRYDMNDLLKFRNFGKKSLTEIEQMVIDKGLHFGMDLAKYKLED
jgi:DNA-directed RNA polymerase subunit alpha